MSKFAKIIQTTHIHERYMNTDPNTGKVREGVSRKDTHRPTYDEVMNPNALPDRLK